MRTTPERLLRRPAKRLCQSWPRAVRPPKPVTTTRRVTVLSGSRGREQFLDHLLHVADGAYALEVLGADLAARHLLELDDHVHGVDAVQVQVLREARLGGDLLRLQVELLHQGFFQGLEYVLWAHACLWRVRFRIILKCRGEPASPCGCLARARHPWGYVSASSRAGKGSCAL